MVEAVFHRVIEPAAGMHVAEVHADADINRMRGIFIAYGQLARAGGIRRDKAAVQINRADIAGDLPFQHLVRGRHPHTEMVEPRVQLNLVPGVQLQGINGCLSLFQGNGIDILGHTELRLSGDAVRFRRQGDRPRLRIGVENLPERIHIPRARGVSNRAAWHESRPIGAVRRADFKIDRRTGQDVIMRGFKKEMRGLAVGHRVGDQENIVGARALRAV